MSAPGQQAIDPIWTAIAEQRDQPPQQQQRDDTDIEMEITEETPLMSQTMLNPSSSTQNPTNTTSPPSNIISRPSTASQAQAQAVSMSIEPSTRGQGEGLAGGSRQTAIDSLRSAASLMSPPAPVGSSSTALLPATPVAEPPSALQTLLATTLEASAQAAAARDASASGSSLATTPAGQADSSPAPRLTAIESLRSAAALPTPRRPTTPTRDSQPTYNPQNPLNFTPPRPVPGPNGGTITTSFFDTAQPIVHSIQELRNALRERVVSLGQEVDRLRRRAEDLERGFTANRNAMENAAERGGIRRGTSVTVSVVPGGVVTASTVPGFRRRGAPAAEGATGPASASGANAVPVPVSTQAAAVDAAAGASDMDVEQEQSQATAAAVPAVPEKVYEIMKGSGSAEIEGGREERRKKRLVRLMDESERQALAARIQAEGRSTTPQPRLTAPSTRRLIPNRVQPPPASGSESPPYVPASPVYSPASPPLGTIMLPAGPSVYTPVSPQYAPASPHYTPASPEDLAFGSNMRIEINPSAVNVPTNLQTARNGTTAQNPVGVSTLSWQDITTNAPRQPRASGSGSARALPTGAGDGTGNEALTMRGMRVHNAMNRQDELDAARRRAMGTPINPEMARNRAQWQAAVAGRRNLPNSAESGRTTSADDTRYRDALLVDAAELLRTAPSTGAGASGAEAVSRLDFNPGASDPSESAARIGQYRHRLNQIRASTDQLTDIALSGAGSGPEAVPSFRRMNRARSTGVATPPAEVTTATTAQNSDSVVNRQEDLSATIVRLRRMLDDARQMHASGSGGGEGSAAVTTDINTVIPPGAEAALDSASRSFEELQALASMVSSLNDRLRAARASLRNVSTTVHEQARTNNIAPRASGILTARTAGIATLDSVQTARAAARSARLEATPAAAPAEAASRQPIGRRPSYPFSHTTAHPHHRPRLGPEPIALVLNIDNLNSFEINFDGNIVFRPISTREPPRELIARCLSMLPGGREDTPSRWMRPTGENSARTRRANPAAGFWVRWISEQVPETSDQLRQRRLSLGDMPPIIAFDFSVMPPEEDAFVRADEVEFYSPRTRFRTHMGPWLHSRVRIEPFDTDPAVPSWGNSAHVRQAIRELGGLRNGDFARFSLQDRSVSLVRSAPQVPEARGSNLPSRLMQAELDARATSQAASRSGTPGAEAQSSTESSGEESWLNAFEPAIEQIRRQWTSHVGAHNPTQYASSDPSVGNRAFNPSTALASGIASELWTRDYLDADGLPLPSLTLSSIRERTSEGASLDNDAMTVDS